MKTKFEFGSSYVMTEEESKRHEEYIKKHKPKGKTYDEVMIREFIDKDKKKRGKSK